MDKKEEERKGVGKEEKEEEISYMEKKFKGMALIKKAQGGRK